MALAEFGLQYIFYIFFYLYNNICNFRIFSLNSTPVLRSTTRVLIFSVLRSAEFFSTPVQYSKYSKVSKQSGRP